MVHYDLKHDIKLVPCQGFGEQWIKREQGHKGLYILYDKRNLTLFVFLYLVKYKFNENANFTRRTSKNVFKEKIFIWYEIWR